MFLSRQKDLKSFSAANIVDRHGEKEVVKLANGEAADVEEDISGLHSSANSSLAFGGGDAVNVATDVHQVYALIRSEAFSMHLSGRASRRLLQLVAEANSHGRLCI